VSTMYIVIQATQEAIRNHNVAGKALVIEEPPKLLSEVVKESLSKMSDSC